MTPRRLVLVLILFGLGAFTGCKGGVACDDFSGGIRSAAWNRCGDGRNRMIMCEPRPEAKRADLLHCYCKLQNGKFQPTGSSDYGGWGMYDRDAVLESRASATRVWNAFCGEDWQVRQP